jgi:hypothetical protein
MAFFLFLLEGMIASFDAVDDTASKLAITGAFIGFLKAKTPPALTQPSKSFRRKRRPLPTFPLSGAASSLTWRLSVCSLMARYAAVSCKSNHVRG